MKKQILLLALILLPMVANADTIEIDGIYYNLISKANIAEVANNPDKYTGIVVVPESVTYEGVDYSVTNIEDFAFYGCRGLTSITIPSSIISIGYDAFWGCSSLTSVNTPRSEERRVGKEC